LIKQYAVINIAGLNIKYVGKTLAVLLMEVPPSMYGNVGAPKPSPGANLIYMTRYKHTLIVKVEIIKIAKLSFLILLI
jgi:hypothetical protein